MVFYVCCRPHRTQMGKIRYVGYVRINEGVLKVMEAEDVKDLEHYAKREGYSQVKWKEPKRRMYQMFRSKDW